MTFNMFYGMFALMLFLHLQRVIPADKIRKSKGHGGYGYGVNPVPLGPENDMFNLLCHYCRIRPDPFCQNRFCQGAWNYYLPITFAIPAFIGYAGGIGFYGFEWYYPDPHDVLCYYCRFYGNIGCLRYFKCLL